MSNEQEKAIIAGESQDQEHGPTAEEQLAASRKFNKAAVVMIIIMMIIMCFMLRSMRNWATEYQGLEERYEQLYMDLKGESNE